jgi:hypothetical protein
MNWWQKILYKFEGKNKAYVSDADQFIHAFDQKNPQRSTSQEKEIAKHHDIFNRKRDQRVKW